MKRNYQKHPDKSIQPKLSKITSLGLQLFMVGLGLCSLTITLNANQGPGKIGYIEISIYAVSSLLMILGGLDLITRNRLLSSSRFRTKSIIKAGLSALAILLFMLLFLEIGSRIYIQLNQISHLYWYTINRHSGDYSVILDCPAYQGLDYATEAFINEVLDSQLIASKSSSPAAKILPNNFEGEFLNVVDNKRMTAFQPPLYEHTIYLFGGSTIFNLAVPDNLTVASYLQQYLNQEMNQVYRVENLGVIGATTQQQLQRLQTLDINNNDIVIFFDGYNDIFKGMQRNHEFFLGLISKSQFFNFMIKPLIAPVLPVFFPPDKIQLQQSYYENIINAYEQTTSQGGIFIHFLQPSLHTVNHPSPYEKMLIQKLLTQARGWHESMLVGYDWLGETQQELMVAGIPGMDARNILNHEYREESHEIFLDDIHVNHLGNQIIAKSIFDLIIQQIKIEK